MQDSRWLIPEHFSHRASGGVNIKDRNPTVSTKGDVTMKTVHKWLAIGLLLAALGWTGQAFAGGANGSTYVLTAFDGEFSLIGLNDQNRSFQAVYGSTTDFKQAVLDKFIPTDPCRTLAEDYNGYVQLNDTVGFTATLTGMAGSSCKARVILDRTSPVWKIRSFQPEP